MSLRKYDGYYYSIINSKGINNKIILTIQVFGYYGKIVNEQIIDSEGKNIPHNPNNLYLFKYNHGNKSVSSKLISNEWFQRGIHAFPKEKRTFTITGNEDFEEEYKKISTSCNDEKPKRKIINGVLIN